MNYSTISDCFRNRARPDLSFTLRIRKVDDVAILLEHVDLLNSLDWLSIQLLQRALELLVVRCRSLVDTLGLAARCTLATVSVSRCAQYLFCLFHANRG